MTVKHRTPQDQDRLDRLKSTMLRDVASRGLTNADLAAMDLQADAKDGEIVAYLYKVELTGGGVLTYRIDREGAVSVNGVVLGGA